MENGKYNWNAIAKYTGIIIIIISFIFAMIFFKTFGGLEATMAFGFMSLGIALFSLGIAGESDEKMTSIATSDFLDIAHRFEDLKNFIVGVDVDSKGKINVFKND